MTVSTATNRADYNGNGSVVDFAVPFRFLVNSDVQVILIDALGVETTQVEVTNYTLVGAGDAAGGTVTMLVAPATGERLTVLRDVPATQETDYVENDSFPAESHEDALDKLTMIVQQQAELIARTLKFTAGSINTSDLDLPVPEAGLFFKWKADLSGVENSGAPGQVVPGTNIGLVSDMKADTSLVVGDFVFTNGYISLGDGGDNSYEIVAAATGTNDGGSFIDLAGSGHQAKALFPNGTINIRQYGAIGDGVADDSAVFSSAATATDNILLPPGTYDVPTGDFSSTFFYDFDFNGVSVTNNSTIVSRNITSMYDGNLSSPDDLNLIQGPAAMRVFSFNQTAVNIPEAGQDGTLLHFEDTKNAAQMVFGSNNEFWLRNDPTAPFDFAASPFRRIVLADGTADFLTITNEIRFEGAVGEDALIQKNATALRDEFQIYANGDAFSTGSLGSGIHLYGNKDEQHAGNFTVLTGQNDLGDARIIASGGSLKLAITSITSVSTTATVTTTSPHELTSGMSVLVDGAGQSEYNIKAVVTVTGASTFTYIFAGSGTSPATGTIFFYWGEGARANTDTRVTIGNAIFDFVDNENDTALLNLKNPSGRPAICFTETNSSTEGELSVPTGEAFSIGHWTGTAFTPRVGMDSGGDWIPMVDDGVNLGDADNRWKEVFSTIGSINTSDENRKQQIGTIPEAVLDAWAEINYCQYKWNARVEEEGELAVFHIGVIAQRIEEAFIKHNVDPGDYSIVLVPEGSGEYSIRPTECLMLEAALQRRELDKIKALLDTFGSV